MQLHSDKLSRFRANQSSLLFIDAVCLTEKHQTPVLKSDLTRQQLEPIIGMKFDTNKAIFVKPLLLICAIFFGYLIA